MASLVIFGYSLAFIACVIGAFSHIYAGTICQKVAVGIIAMWCASRVHAVLFGGEHLHQEVMLSGGLLLLGVGTILKTCFWHGQERRTFRA